jgi:hypothetical protein
MKMDSHGNREQFVGAIIEESLEDRGVLNEITILRTSVEPTTPQARNAMGRAMDLA